MADRQTGSMRWLMLLATIAGMVCSQLDILSMFYMVPVLVAVGKCHDASRFLPVVTTGLFALASSLWQSRNALHTEIGRIAVCISVLLPAALWVSALVWVTLDGKPTMKRYVASILPGCVAAVVLVWFLSRGGEQVGMLDLAMQNQFLSLFEAFGVGVDGVVRSRLAEVYRIAVRTLGCMIVPVIMVLCGFGSFLSLASTRRLDQDFNDEVASLRFGDRELWLFLLSWLLVAVGHFLGFGYGVMTTALNFALGMSVLYGLQGFAIVLWRGRRHNPYLAATTLFWRFFIIGILIPVAGTLICLVFTLLGVTETWIQYRKPKENSYETHSESGRE